MVQRRANTPCSPSAHDSERAKNCQRSTPQRHVGENLITHPPFIDFSSLFFLPVRPLIRGGSPCTQVPLPASASRAGLVRGLE